MFTLMVCMRPKYTQVVDGVLDSKESGSKLLKIKIKLRETNPQENYCLQISHPEE